jgi:phosphonate transport system substrate-binding protein
MTYHFTVSPDFGPDRLPGWYFFNTWLQRTLEQSIHLEIYPDFDSQRAAIEAGRVDLIYANPYDASVLVRERGFVPLARPKDQMDEVVVAVRADRDIAAVEDLRPGLTAAVADDPEVRMVGLIMLEPANLDAGDIALKVCDSHILVAKRLIRGECDIGIFPADAFQNFTSLVKSPLRVLAKSQIQTIHHTLMLGPELIPHRERLLDALLAATPDEQGREVPDALGIRQWEPVDPETMEFMIDLMDTLLV